MMLAADCGASLELEVIGPEAEEGWDERPGY